MQNNTMTQEQMFYTASRRSADANQGFLNLVADGMTKQELEKNIARRPALWGRWSNWLAVLPDE
jgi:hypothetical protein